MAIPVIDVFAGPGGLNEGFSSLRRAGEPIFSTQASFEMDPVACETLRLRSAVRRVRLAAGEMPTAYLDFLRGHRTAEQLVTDPDLADALTLADKEVHQFELSEGTRSESDARIAAALGPAAGGNEPWVLIGGPPCQAYSLAGRSRRTNDVSFKDDHKHTLYREYLHIIRRFRPAVFVMENVKGMLSAQHGGGRIFEAIRADLSEPAADLGYDVRSFVVAGAGADLDPTDFVIRSERYGVPQTRHRVILLGIRSDVTPPGVPVLHESSQMTVRDAIGDLPRIRSGISPRSQDSARVWERALLTARAHAGVTRSKRSIPPLGQEREGRYRPRGPRNDLEHWLRADAPAGISQHQSRYHMPADLERYAYLAYRAAKGDFPRVNDLPLPLRPQHRNAGRDDTPFVDRFRVQRWNAPSSTVVSHMAKDGHYYIHPDPEQMRSLTVREAARLQTFPDNYHFIGSRTQQYHQVGNAVPPLLARQLGQVVAAVLGIQPTTG